MRLLLILIWATLTAASNFHYAPTKLLLEKVSSSADTAPANTQYHEQDSDGFYSYGYSADRSAKAEYLTVDGSSKGFYSYIDADGKLQTVKYEAGKEQGFKAAATNLPKAPKNLNAVAPLPVKDTPEVQQAKKAHFEAYREAELRAALATQKDANDAELVAQMQLEAREQQQPKDERRTQQQTANILADTRNRILAILAETADAENGNKNSAAAAQLNDNQLQLQVQASAGAGGAAAAVAAVAPVTDINQASLSDNNGFLSIEEFRSNGGASGDDDDDGDGANDMGRDAQRSNNGGSLSAAQNTDDLSAIDLTDELSGAHRQMTTYKLPDLLAADAAQLSDRSLYAFDVHSDEQSSHGRDLLRLAELRRKAAVSYGTPKLTTIETVRVPVHSYYTVLAPNNKYSVLTPTTLTSVPREEALKRGHSLPISLSSSFLSHRLKAN